MFSNREQPTKQAQYCDGNDGKHGPVDGYVMPNNHWRNLAGKTDERVTCELQHKGNSNASKKENRTQSFSS